MNDVKVVPWRRWLLFLGLGIPLPLYSAPDFPSPAPRILQELQRAGLDDGADRSARDFLDILAERMPYLDGGTLFAQACDRIGHVPRPHLLSPLLSAALRDLHDEGIVVLRPRGDASDAVRLTDDPAHPIQAFSIVIVNQGAA